MKVSQSRWRTPRRETARRHQRCSRAVRAGRELSVPRRVPASMPGRIWESSTGPGRCVRAFSGGRGRGRGRQRKMDKKRRMRELLFFIFECQWWFLTALNTHVYRLGDQGYEIWHKNSRGRGVKYSAVPVSPPLRASAVWCPLRPSSLLLLRPNGSYQHGTDTRCSPSKMSLILYHSE